jgi:glycosyltransferase involved in cell wall biosynthesis
MIKPLRGKILVVCHTAPPPGGMETYVEHMFASDLARRYDMRLFDTRKRTAPNRFVITGIISQLIILVNYVLYILRFRPDIIHIHTASRSHFFRRSIDVLFGKVLARKIVLQVHGGAFQSFWEESGKLARAYIRMVLQLADIVIVLSSGWREKIGKMKGNKRDIQVVPNGIVTQPFNPATKKQSEVNNDRVKILFVGSLSRLKGIYDLMHIIPDIIVLHPKSQFIIVGDEKSPGIIQELSNIIPEQYYTHVHFRGPLFGRDKIMEYKQADIFVLPSYAENFPLVMLEAMAAGLPLVISKVGAVPDVIKHEVNGLLIDPGDKESLKESILRLIDDRPLRIRMGQTNLLESRDYDFAMTAEKIDRTYQLVLSA